MTKHDEALKRAHEDDQTHQRFLVEKRRISQRAVRDERAHALSFVLLSRGVSTQRFFRRVALWVVLDHARIDRSRVIERPSQRSFSRIRAIDQRR